MTVFDYNPGSLDIVRALNLAVAAYESRTGHPPPLITEPKQIAGLPDILQYQFQPIAGGKIVTVTAAEYRRDLLFMSMFASFRTKRDGDGTQQQPRRPRIRSMAEWYELKRGRDLRRIARANPDLRRELLNTFERCPCCDHPLDHASGKAKQS
jgi:hypothetical protein